MHQIQIRLPSDDCDGMVRDMRRWMTAHGCEPVDFFVHDLERNTAVVVIEFKNESDRCAFADQFVPMDGD